MEETSTTNLSSHESGDSKSLLSKKDIFYSSYLSQDWSLPDSVIYYILKNPSTPKLYLKIIQSCKYFFIKNPILPVGDLYYFWEKDKWQIPAHNGTLDVGNVVCKFWISQYISVEPAFPGKEHLISSFIPKLFRCDITTLSLNNQILTFNDFKIITSKVKIIDFRHVTIQYEDGTDVPFEKLVEAMPNVKNIEYFSNNPISSITAKTVKELLKIPHFSKIEEVILSYLFEDFDIEAFYAYITQNKVRSYFNIAFHNSVSEEFEARLEEIVDEILAQTEHDYNPPCISYPNMDEKKFSNLEQLGIF